LPAVLRLLFVVPLAYIVAIAAAAAVVSAAASNLIDNDSTTLAFRYFFTMSAMGAVAFVPAGIVIAAAEIFRLRSVFYFLGVGGCLGIALNAANSAGTFGLVLDRENAVFPAAGFVAGFVYWLIVGRLPGRFGLTPTPLPLPPVRADQPEIASEAHVGDKPVDRPLRK
jgi:hypothetical protein